MALFDYIRLVLLTSFVVHGAKEGIDPDHLRADHKICNNITSEPFFNITLVVSTTWTVYYSWNLKLAHDCPEVTFNYPNETIINRIYSQMQGYLIKQPPWSEAALDMTMEGRGMLLFNDISGVPGRFFGVPFIEDDVFQIAFKAVKIPLLETAIKILEGGKYLLSSSCHVGGGTVLAVRRKNRPSKAEVDLFASTYNFGKRFPACVKPY